MPENSSERIISLTISGRAAERGRVPIKILAEKLDALQEAIYGAANALFDISGASKGNWNNQLASCCKIVFRDFKKGSLTIEAEVEEKEEIPLLDELDLGLQALKGFKETSQAIKNRDVRKIQQLMPVPASRERFLGKYKKLYPESEEYQVSIGNGRGSSYADLTKDAIEEIDRLEFTDEVETTISMRGKISGIFIEIRVGDNKRHFIIKTSEGDFKCGFTPDTENYIQQIPTGSLIEVACMIDFNEDRSIKQIGKVFEVDIVKLTKQKFKKFKWGDKKYILKKPVKGTLKLEDGLWVYEVPRYGLHTYSYNRMEAFYALQEDFAFQCDDLLHEEDDNLTPAAIRLRDTLKNDILRTQKVREDD